MTFRFVALLFLGTAFFLTLRLAIAEADFRLHPELALAWVRAANMARYGSSSEQLRAAVTLNPRLASAWIQLGLDAEADGDLAEAETDFLRAARVDHLYLPAWTLADFYFHRGDLASFWPWARRATALTDDYHPLLRLADDLGMPAQDVAVRLGGGAPLLRTYLDVLIGANRLDSAREIALLLAANHDPADQERLVEFAKRLK